MFRTEPFFIFLKGSVRSSSVKIVLPGKVYPVEFILGSFLNHERNDHLIDSVLFVKDDIPVYLNHIHIDKAPGPVLVLYGYNIFLKLAFHIDTLIEKGLGA